MASVDANGITIEYEDEGVGEPLLLVMGLGGQLIDWPREFIDDLLDQGFRVIRLDNRDSGLSTEIDSEPPTTGQLLKGATARRFAPDVYTLGDMADDAFGLLDALGVERAHIVGVSMGGMIAQTMAIARPDRVLSLTSIMSTTGHRGVGRPKAGLVRSLARRDVPSRETAVESTVEMFRAICGPRFDEQEFRRMAEESVARSYRPAGTARQLAAILAAPDRTPALQRLDVPTLVVHGLVDPLVRHSGGVATAKAVPDSRLLMFNDMGHDLPPTRIVEIARAIRSNADRAAQPA